MPMQPRTVAATSAAVAIVLTQAANFIKPWEGFYPKPYYDIVHVKTVCYGATSAEGVDLNRTYTKAECDKMLVDGLPKYYFGMVGCIKSDKPLPVSLQVAFTSATFNFGVHNFCGSSMAKRASKGDYKGACEALLMWNKAGGRFVQGLANRRQAEYKLCIKDV